MTVSVVLLLAGVAGFSLLAVLSLFLAMVSDGCFEDRCDTGLLTVGWFIAVGGPPVVFLTAVVWTLVRIGRRLTAWWVPLAGAAAAGIVWGIGVGIMQASIDL